jgi:hypothetical protein
MKLMESNSLVLALDRAGNPGTCTGCYHRKNNRTPAEWGIELIAVPYAPCYAEHLILNGKTILVDQMEFLLARVRRR